MEYRHNPKDGYLVTKNGVYEINQVVRTSASFLNSGTLADPTTIEYKYKRPNGTIITYTSACAALVHDSTGIYHVDLTIDQAGSWYYRFSGSGVATGADEEIFNVIPSQF